MPYKILDPEVDEKCAFCPEKATHEIIFPDEKFYVCEKSFQLALAQKKKEEVEAEQRRKEFYAGLDGRLEEWFGDPKYGR